MSLDKQPIPSLEAFLAAPLADVVAVAPATMVLAGAGTRREAILHNVPMADYGDWSFERMIEVCQRLFMLGVQNVFVSMIRSTQVAEAGDYGARLWSMARATLGDAHTIAMLAKAGFRIRCFGASDMPELADVLAQIEHVTERPGPTLWWMFARTLESPWNHALAAISAAGATTHEAAIRAIYGAALPPVGIYLSFGKPFFSAELMPPLLEGQAAAFWYQQPGYLPLTEAFLRRIFYEAAYTRATWTSDKTARYDDVPAQRHVWNQPLVLGLGQRVGAFWYPLSDGQQQDEGRAMPNERF